MRKTIIFTVILAGILFLPACKKTESTDTTPSLQGLDITEAVPYVAKGADIVLKADASHLSSSNGKPFGNVGIFWQVNSAKKDTLTRNVNQGNPEFKYHVDTLGTYQIACYAFPGEEYHFYNASAITSFKAIEPSTALTGIGTAASVTIDGNEWSTRNLDNPSSGVAYKKADVTTSSFGRLYTFQEASTACPAGWHLPTAEEWDALGTEAGNLMAPAKFLDLDMWVPALGQKITNSTGFNAIPVGYLDNTASLDKFRRYGEMAAFWTSSDSASDSSLAQFRYILYDNPAIMKGNGSKTSLAFSVRCVKD